MPAKQILDFLFNLSLPGKIPKDASILNPWKEIEVRKCCEAFYRKYYQNKNQRILMLGINPGRMGAGLTGIPFTDPVELELNCGIENSFPKKSELTSAFIYQVIDAMGGPSDFFEKFYISAVCPLGFVKHGKNLNYYDLPELKNLVEQKFPEWLTQQFKFGLSAKVCICVGEGKNFEFLTEMNQKHKLFDEIVGLPHPRFIMQYKRKELKNYVKIYQKKLTAALKLL